MATTRSRGKLALAAAGFLMLFAPAACRSAGEQPGSVPSEPPFTQPPSAQASQDVPVPGRCEMPVVQRTGEAGCYLIASTPQGELPDGPLFWHLHTYPTAGAAEAARPAGGTVVESFARVWLFTLAAEAWSPPGGERVAVIGPLPTARGMSYTARYMEAVFPPGMHGPAVGHRHSGPEAWFVLTGAQCLETPDGVIVAQAGEGAVVPQGPPMAISSVGPEIRRAVVLVLHPSAEPWVAPAPDWNANGLCPR